MNRRALALPLLLSSLFASHAASETTEAGPIAGSSTATISDFESNGYGKPNQSRLWYVSARDRWDALIPRDLGLPNGSDHAILKDVTGAQTFTAIVLEDRDTARPDTFWLDDERRLYVLGSHGSLTRFWSVSYDGASDSYAIDAAVAGVEVPGLVHGPSPGENRPATLHVTPNGRVWAAVMRAGALEVQLSEDGGQSWLVEPVSLDASVSVGVTAWSRFTHAGETYAGLFAAENGEGGTVQTRFFYWFIREDADPTVLANWTDESSSIPAPTGVETSDDHASATWDDDGNQYFAAKTEFGLPEDPRIQVFKRTPGGVWSAFTVTKTADQPEHTRPAVTIDELAGKLYVYTTATGGGDARRVVAPLDQLEQLGTVPPLTLLSNPGESFDDVLAPRHAISAASEAVVIAHNETTKTVWYASEAIPDDFCMLETGGTPQQIDATAVQADVAGIVSVRVWRPDPELQIAPCPLVSLIPRAFGTISEMDWAARRLARDGYVVVVVDAAQDNVTAYDRALRSGINFGLSSANPWLAVTDTSRIGAIAGPYAASALTRTQFVDPRVDTIVAWDNLARHEGGDWGSPDCQLLPGQTRTPKVPAMGIASERCLKLFEAKKTAYNWWRSHQMPSMEVVLEGVSPNAWGPTASEERHDLIHYYTVAWLDRWLKDDAAATAKLVSREVEGAAVGVLLDAWYRSGAFLDGYDCPNLRASCSN